MAPASRNQIARHKVSSSASRPSALPAAASDSAAASKSRTQAAITELKQRGLYASLQEAMQQSRYAVEPAKSGEYGADNPAQHITARSRPQASGCSGRTPLHPRRLTLH